MRTRTLLSLLIFIIGCWLSYAQAQSADLYRQAAANERNAAAQCPEPGKSCHLSMAGYYDCLSSGGACTQPTCNGSCTSSAGMNTAGCPAGQAHPSLNNPTCAPVVGTRGTSGGTRNGQNQTDAYGSQAKESDKQRLSIGMTQDESNSINGLRQLNDDSLLPLSPNPESDSAHFSDFLSDIQSQVKNAATDQIESEGRDALLNSFGDWVHSSIPSIPADLPQTIYSFGEKGVKVWNDFNDLQGGDPEQQIQATGDLTEVIAGEAIESPVIGAIVEQNQHVITASSKNTYSRGITTLDAMTNFVSGDPDPALESQLEQDTRHPEDILVPQWLAKAKKGIQTVQTGFKALEQLISGSPQ